MTSAKCLDSFILPCPQNFTTGLNKLPINWTSYVNHATGLPATGAGMAELQTLLKSSLFDLMCDDLDQFPKERPPPKPESVRAMEGLKSSFVLVPGR